MSTEPATEKGLHHRIWPYMDHLVQYATDRVDGEGPWIVRDRSAALRAERKGEGPAMVRTWVPGPWAYVTPQEPKWSIDLPGWHSIPDPEYPGSLVWYHTGHGGNADIAIARGDTEGDVIVLGDPTFDAHSVCGDELKVYDEWEPALEFALAWLKDAR